MKTRCRSVLAAYLALVSAMSAFGAQNTAFTYQEMLTEGAGPANGEYDLIFLVYDAGFGGSHLRSLPQDRR